MRIALDLHDLCRTGGLERVAAGLAVEMARRGHEVTAFTWSPPGTPPRFALPDGLRLRHYVFTGDAATVRPLREELTAYAPDVFISPSSFNNVLFWSAVLHGTGIPLLYSEHNNPWRIEEERWDKAERQAVLWAADAVHLLLPAFLESVPPALRGKCRIIGNAVPVPDALPPRTEHAPCLLSLGRYARVKQIPLLVQAFALLAADFPDWELHIWGTGEDETAIRKAASAAACRRICLHGLAEHPEQQFAQADIFCIPSRFEGFGLTVVEAFGHGVPVVGFAGCSGVNSLVRPGQNGALAEEMTPESLADSLRPLMEDPALRQRLGRTARQDALAFAPSAIYDQWESLLRETAARKGCTQLQLLDAPGREHRDAISHGHRLNLVVRDVDDREAELLLETADLNAHGRTELSVEVGERLVHKAERRVAADAPSEGHALALTARQRTGLAVEVVGEAEYLGSFGKALLLLGLRHLLDVETEEDVVANREVRVKRVALKHHGEVALAGQHLVGEFAVHDELTGGNALEAGDDAQKRRLAAAGGPDEDKELPLLYLEVDAPEHLGLAVVALLKVLAYDFCHYLTPCECGTPLRAPATPDERD